VEIKPINLSWDRIYKREATMDKDLLLSAYGYLECTKTA